MREIDMIIAGTGHRPNKLGGYSPLAVKKVTDLALSCLQEYAPSLVISGMALGWDSALAYAALELQIPLTCAIPFIGQEKMWPASSQKWYHETLARATTVITCSPGGYDVRKMQIRNCWMVDHCDTVLALWNGTSGGTANCIGYAKSIGRPIVNVWSLL
jgi:uncharacterized phage-like protein YoqJ